MISDASDLQQLTGCSRDICRCTLMGAQLGTTYCSDYCKNADDDAIESEACGCGHPPCDDPQ